MSPDAPREKSVHGIPEDRDPHPLGHPTASDGTMDAERPASEDGGASDEFDREHAPSRGHAGEFDREHTRSRGGNADETQTDSRPSEPDLVDPTEERE